MFKDNGEVIHFANPKVQASLSSNTFAISGPSDTKCKYKIALNYYYFEFCFSSTRNVTNNHVTNGYVN
jgi:hypothetical protein